MCTFRAVSSFGEVFFYDFHEPDIHWNTTFFSRKLVWILVVRFSTSSSSSSPSYSTITPPMVQWSIVGQRPAPAHDSPPAIFGQFGIVLCLRSGWFYFLVRFLCCGGGLVFILLFFGLDALFNAFSCSSRHSSSSVLWWFELPPVGSWLVLVFRIGNDTATPSVKLIEWNASWILKYHFQYSILCASLNVTWFRFRLDSPFSLIANLESKRMKWFFKRFWDHIVEHCFYYFSLYYLFT